MPVRRRHPSAFADCVRRRPDAVAVAVLNSVLLSKADWPVRLAAANAIARLSDRAPFIAALQATELSEEYLQRIVPWLLGRAPTVK